MAVLPRSQVTTPHPVPLPQGEGTPEWRSAGATPFLLPGGEGQDEGRFAPFKALPPSVRGADALNFRPHIFNSGR